MNQLHKNKDFLSGLMFIVFGVIFFYGAYDYTIGTAARMGPGYYPRILGGLLIALGIVILIIGLKNHQKLLADGGIQWTWKPLVLVTIAVILFGLALNTLGMLAAITVLVMLAGLAAHDRNFLQLIMITVIMCLFSASVFVWGLNLQLKLFPWS